MTGTSSTEFDLAALRELLPSTLDPDGAVERISAHMHGLQDDMDAVTATEVSDDGMVEVTVGAHGNLVDLVIDPRVFRDTDSGRLADSILQAAAAAGADAARQIGELAGPAERDAPAASR